MHQLKAAFRGVAHRRQTRMHKVPIIDHILTAVRPVETGLTAEAPNPAKARTEEHVRIQSGKVERRDNENASREGKCGVDYRISVWRQCPLRNDGAES
ncbi:hypothetical protein M378DRAFT_167613 [Amanita muscaria Koide BX008]|uniref:Uncharacterized protein n=1 Tax=Amanita muscaria (strain Koide BX008) TaxID=946122 RepID=A0A0C2WVW0_AMAMK|nr:hypothetical protein M378DRAFT_167613 [Amanita muscaria Koide BX008]